VTTPVHFAEAIIIGSYNGDFQLILMPGLTTGVSHAYKGAYSWVKVWTERMQWSLSFDVVTSQ
jgi:hypothetical protein